jgi:hypothetical protein
MAKTPPEIIDPGIGLGNKAYAPFRGSNVTRITFPAVVALEGKWLRFRPLKFRQNLFGEISSRVCDRFAARQSSIRQQCGPFGSAHASKTEESRRTQNAAKREGSALPWSGHESEGQEARAEQDQTGSGQGQETVGDRIMMAHVTSSFSDARPN